MRKEQKWIFSVSEKECRFKISNLSEIHPLNDNIAKTFTPYNHTFHPNTTATPKIPSPFPYFHPSISNRPLVPQPIPSLITPILHPRHIPLPILFQRQIPRHPHSNNPLKPPFLCPTYLFLRGKIAFPERHEN